MAPSRKPFLINTIAVSLSVLISIYMVQATVRALVHPEVPADDTQAFHLGAAGAGMPVDQPAPLQPAR